MKSRTATIMGLVAMAFWATAHGTTRFLIEELGLFGYVGIAYTGSGLFLLAVEAIRRGSLSACVRLPWKYLLFAGLGFVTYGITNNIASYLPESREVFLQVVLVNYLWPAALLLFSVPILGKTARWHILLPGIAIGFAGIAVATSREGSLASCIANLSSDWPAFLIMFAAAISWGLYSNFAKKFTPKDTPSGVPLFQLAVGITFLFTLPWYGKEIDWSLSLGGCLVYATLFPTAIAYILWEVGMQKGDHTFLGISSFFIPLASTLFSCWLLGVRPEAGLFTGCALVILGALLSRKGISEKTLETTEDE